MKHKNHFLKLLFVTLMASIWSCSDIVIPEQPVTTKPPPSGNGQFFPVDEARRYLDDIFKGISATRAVPTQLWSLDPDWDNAIITLTSKAARIVVPLRDETTGLAYILHKGDDGAVMEPRATFRQLYFVKNYREQKVHAFIQVLAPATGGSHGCDHGCGHPRCDPRHSGGIKGSTHHSTPGQRVAVDIYDPSTTYSGVCTYTTLGGVRIADRHSDGGRVTFYPDYRRTSPEERVRLNELSAVAGGGLLIPASWPPTGYCECGKMDCKYFPSCLWPLEDRCMFCQLLPFFCHCIVIHPDPGCGICWSSNCSGCDVYFCGMCGDPNCYGDICGAQCIECGSIYCRGECEDRGDDDDGGIDHGEPPIGDPLPYPQPNEPGTMTADRMVNIIDGVVADLIEKIPELATVLPNGHISVRETTYTNFARIIHFNAGTDNYSVHLELNTSRLSRASEIGMTFITLHEFYHVYGVMTHGTSDQLRDHSEMINGNVFISWVRDLIPGQSEEFYRYILYSGVQDTPEWDNLSENESNIVKNLVRSHIRGLND